MVSFKLSRVYLVVHGSRVRDGLTRGMLVQFLFRIFDSNVRVIIFGF